MRCVSYHDIHVNSFCLSDVLYMVKFGSIGALNIKLFNQMPVNWPDIEDMRTSNGNLCLFYDSGITGYN